METNLIKDMLDGAMKTVTEKVNELKTSMQEEIKNEIKSQTEKVNENFENKLKSIQVNPVADIGNNFGFKSIGELLKSVAKSEIDKTGILEDRMITLKNYSRDNAKALNESVDSLGGFLVPPEFANTLLTSSLEQTNIMKDTQQLRTVSNTLELPVIKDKNRSNGQTSGGIYFYWMSESGTFQEAKPAFEKLDFKLNKLGAMTYITEELLEDSAAIESVVNTEFQKGFVYFMDGSLISGTGVGQPEGILKSPALKTVAKESGQTDAIKVENIANMFASFSGTMGKWYINKDLFPYLFALAVGNFPVFIPGGSIAGRPFDSLLGMPIVWTEHASALKSVGDIILADFSQYVTVTKNGQGLKNDASMHVRFLYDEMTYKFSYRITGKTKDREVITPKNSQGTKSAFVTLAAR